MPESATKPRLFAFLNWLGLPQVSWVPVIGELWDLWSETNIPALLTYDRSGQGQATDRGPSDAGPAGPTHGHDYLSAITDFHQLIFQIGAEKLNLAEIDQPTFPR